MIQSKTKRVRALTFTIPFEKMVQFRRFQKKHDETCETGVRSCVFMSRYTFTFRSTSLGDDIHMICVCGEKFYADAGDDKI